MSSMQQLYLLLADGVLVVHAAFVVFVVLGLVLIWLGRYRGWRFVRNFWFRMAHLAAIGLVAAESLTGLVCPLTIWENQLRLVAGGDQRYAGSFIQHWLHQVLFFDVDTHIFTLAYGLFFLAVILSFWWIRPDWPGRGSRRLVDEPCGEPPPARGDEGHRATVS